MATNRKGHQTVTVTETVTDDKRTPDQIMADAQQETCMSYDQAWADAHQTVTETVKNDITVSAVTVISRKDVIKAYTLALRDMRKDTIRTSNGVYVSCEMYLNKSGAYVYRNGDALHGDRHNVTVVSPDAIADDQTFMFKLVRYAYVRAENSIQHMGMNVDLKAVVEVKDTYYVTFTETGVVALQKSGSDYVTAPIFTMEVKSLTDMCVKFIKRIQSGNEAINNRVSVYKDTVTPYGAYLIGRNKPDALLKEHAIKRANSVVTVKLQ